MAVVRAVRALQGSKPLTRRRFGDSGKEEGGVRVGLKWPNDIYAYVPPKDGADGKWIKVGGVLITSSYAGSAYSLTVGIGLNVSNTAGPTTCLNHLCSLASVRPFEHETLLASILGSLEDLYNQFCGTGWDARLEDEYLGMWLHSEQIVTVESEGGLRAKIKGITRDWGLLVAEELGPGDRATGHMVTLQSDNNSFDFFRGLIKRKM
jgi:biotin--protein ligase